MRDPSTNLSAPLSESVTTLSRCFKMWHCFFFTSIVAAIREEPRTENLDAEKKPSTSVAEICEQVCFVWIQVGMVILKLDTVSYATKFLDHSNLLSLGRCPLSSSLTSLFRQPVFSQIRLQRHCAAAGAIALRKTSGPESLVSESQTLI